MELRIQRKMIKELNCIQNTLYLESEPLALVHVYPAELECTLTWFVSKNTKLIDLISECNHPEGVFSAYKQIQEKLKIECWINDSFIEKPLDPLLFGFSSDFELLQISCRELTLEILFDETNKRPNRITLLFSRIEPHQIGEFFNAFHKNSFVHINPLIWRDALTSGLFSPLIMEGLPNDRLEKDIWIEDRPRSSTPRFMHWSSGPPRKGKN